MSGKITQAVEVDLSIKGAPATKSLKQELREATQEAISLSRKFGEMSPQAIKAAQKVAQIKDEVEDLGHRIKALNPDKFSKIGTAAAGLAHGFSAAQGAAALMGSESELVTQSLLKVQGAMALSQGLQGLGDAKQGLGALVTMIKGPVVSAFSTMKGAILATGIGALVIGVGSLITYFKMLGDSALEAAEAEEKALADKGKLAAKLLALNNMDLERNQKLDQARIKAQGGTNDDLIKSQEWYLKRKAQLIQDALSETQNDTDESIQLQKQLASAINDVHVFELDNQAKANELKKQAAQKAAEEQKKLNEERVQAERDIAGELAKLGKNEREIALMDLTNWRNEEAKKVGENNKNLLTLYRGKEKALRDAWAKEDKENLKQIEEDKLAAQKKALEDQQKLAADEFSKTQEITASLYQTERLALLNQLRDKEITKDEFGARSTAQEVARLQRQIQDAYDYGKSSIDLEIQLADLKLKNADEASAKQIALAKSEAEARLLLLNSTLSSVNDLAQLMTNNEEKRNKISKAYALAQIAIDTAQAISALVRNSEANPLNAVTGGIAGIAQFAAGIARIIANVNKAAQLLKAPSPAAAGGGSSAGAIGGSRAPGQFEQVGQDIRVAKLGASGSTGGTGDGGTQKVAVVEFADIRRVQRRVEVLDQGGDL